MLDATKAKLRELGEAGEGAWERVRDIVENAWGALSTAIRGMRQPTADEKAADEGERHRPFFDITSIRAPCSTPSALYRKCIGAGH